jgi:exopolyphosphatase / guanosine-5'-triphosphate,3'-diphosphate pyrophosphatase
MRVGVIDVGSNTVRLLVAERSGAGVLQTREERAVLSLGAEIERCGKLPARKIEETASAVRKFARRARARGAVEVTVLITSPGRQASNGAELAERIVQSSGTNVRLLSAEDEGRLAYAGALAQAGPREGVVAVCDVGGGSSQIVVGIDPAWPSWARSIDIGSLRLTQRCVSRDPPAAEELEAARKEAAEAFGALIPPLPRTALATGGTARALERIAGQTLDAEAFERVLEVIGSQSARAVAHRYHIPRWRVRLLPAGTLLLREACLLLGVPLEVARGGLREGAALELLERAAAVA